MLLWLVLLWLVLLWLLLLLLWEGNRRSAWGGRVQIRLPFVVEIQPSTSTRSS